MKRHIRRNEDIFGMANVVGKYVTEPGKLPFSFYFSSNDGNAHGIHVKICMNPERMRANQLGFIELHGDWKVTPGPEDQKKNFNEAIKFSRNIKSCLLRYGTDT